MTIDRRHLVRQHNPVITSPHPTNTLTVGNGDIAMTVDLSGLQTFPSFHELRSDPLRVRSDGASGLPKQRRRAFDRDDFQIPLRTQANWGWYSTRTSLGIDPDSAVTVHCTARGLVPYHDRMGLQRAGDPIPDELGAAAWLSFNPRRLHLGRLALDRSAGPDITDPSQLSGAITELDLWSGTVHASFELDGKPVEVTTVAHPRDHRFGARITSPALADGLAVSWVFDPQPDDLASFELPLEEQVSWHQLAPGRWSARRLVEATQYLVEIDTTGVLALREGGGRVTATGGGESLEIVVSLRPVDDPDDIRGTDGRPTFTETQAASVAWWERYWTRGAVVSLEGSTDWRASELERRIVLSQYLTVVNGSGVTPPAETGLTYNTWTGKFHLEMHWWHAAHFPMWGRGDLLERSLSWYHGALVPARATASSQGYRGVRWPKQTDPSGRESPSHIGVFLVWQQPHIIHLLELLHHEGRDTSFLQTHYPLVEATADFMADFVEDRDGVFTLPPPLIPAQESYLVHRSTNANPTFELAYWAWALTTANRWRERLELPEREDWRRVADGMARPLMMPEGGYAALATRPFLVREDHPSMLMALGWLPPTELVDPEIMAKTLDDVWSNWDLLSTWGWDYPVMAMTAAALGDLGRAFEALLLPSAKNEYLANGHNPQIPGFLSLYLPANGGLLAAVAHLVAAVDRGAAIPQGWTLDAEGFSTLTRFQQETADASAQGGWA